MKRKVVLSERASLWEQGDAARSVGVVESGRIGIMTDRGLIGSVLPGMIIGENAVFTLLGEKRPRAASYFAMEEDTTVTELSIFYFKSLLDEGRYDSGQQLLISIIVQSCRDLELVSKQSEHLPLIVTSLNAMMRRITESYSAQLSKVNNWESFVQMFRYLAHLRDFSWSARETLVTHNDKVEVARVSELVQRTFLPADSPLPSTEARIPIKDNASPEAALLERFESPLAPTIRATARKSGTNQRSNDDSPMRVIEFTE